MKCNKPCLILRQFYLQTLFDLGNRIFSEFILLRIKPLDLPQQCIFKVDPLCISRNRKINMIRKRHINALIQLQLQCTFCIRNNITRDLCMLQRDSGKQLFKLICHASAFDPENLFYLIFRDLCSRSASKTDPASHDYDFSSYLIKS